MIELQTTEMTVARAHLARPRATVARIGRWAALTASFGVAAYGLVQILQVLGVVSGPLADALIFGTSLAISPPFLIAMLALHDLTQIDRRFFSQGAVSFSTLYVGFAMLIYVVQLASVIPATLAGSAPPVLLLSPHSLFWTVDALAYISMGIAALFAAFAIDRSRDDRRLFWACIAHAAMTPVIGLVYFSPRFSIPLLLLGAPWLATGLALTLFLASHLRRFAKSATSL